MSRARGTVRAEANVACAVGAPLFSFRRCHVRTAAPLERAAWYRAIGVKSVSLELLF